MSPSQTSRRRIRLGVNVDHIATIRQARGTQYPDPLFGAALAELAGADQITIHLREDRRHIQERDLRLMRDTVQVPLNLEMAATDEMVGFALQYRPDTVTLVPEKREEQTTEGGLDVVSQLEALAPVCVSLREAGIVVSTFIDPEADQVRASQAVGATVVELHTGDFCDAPTQAIAQGQLARLHSAAISAHEIGLVVAAGHGIDYQNVRDVIALPHVEELNIGHSIIARALFVGLERAVAEMLERM
ncbi:MAG: pyridoxine 5'-phosphate synthase, partial [Alphaproteobacteria bacterium]|nr:pyridoxine 5'-phosphate synthase [Alphaproteobacteria bacterium]